MSRGVMNADHLQTAPWRSGWPPAARWCVWPAETSA